MASADAHVDDETLDALIEGSMAPLARDALEHHLDSCPPCRRLVSDLLRTEAFAEAHEPQEHDLAGTPLAPGDMLGRYVLVSLVGAGGMGRVFEAYDTNLSRLVAIKVLTARVSNSARKRFVSEGLTLARLDHTNIVRVYDVGEERGCPYIAMELIRGRNLLQWVDEDSPRPRQITAAIIAAGHGLYSSHCAGIIHRDVKPSNIVRTANDGRITVVDFGLCESVETSQQAAGPTLVGTPGYAAPEQIAGGTIDERADQYGLCATLFRLLSGRTPVEGESTEALLRNSSRGELPDEAAAISWRLLRVIRRGLSPDPTQRYPSMAMLLTALERANRSRMALLALGSVTALAVAGSAWALNSDEGPACVAASDVASTIWGQRRARAQAVFCEVAGSHGAEAFDLADARLSARVDAWANAWSKTCAADHSGHLDATAVHVRTACLTRQRASLDEVAESFQQADTVIINSAVPASLALPDAADCLAADGIAHIEPHVPTALRARVSAVRGVISEAIAAQSLGRAKVAARYLTEAERLAEGVDYPPLTAELLLLRSGVVEAQGDYAVARAAAQEAAYLAETVGHDYVAAQSKARTIFIVGTRLRQTDDALLLAPFARAAIERLPPAARGNLVPDLLLNLASTARVGGRSEESLRLLADVERVLPPLDSAPRLHAKWHDERGKSITGDSAQAAAEHERAYEILSSNMGTSHPLTLFARATIGSREIDLGHYEAGVTRLGAVLEVLDSAIGPKHPQRAPMLVNLAQGLSGLGRHAEAGAALQEALALRATSSTPPTLRVSTLVHYAHVNIERQRFEDAANALELATEILSDAPAARTTSRTGLELALARLSLEQGEFDEARTRLHALLFLVRASDATAPDDRLNVLMLLGSVALASGETQEAIDRFAEARDVAATANPTQPFVSVATMHLGRAHLAAGHADVASALLAAALGDSSPAMPLRHVAEARRALTDANAAATQPSLPSRRRR